jgi:hypothetical protein
MRTALLPLALLLAGPVLLCAAQPPARDSDVDRAVERGLEKLQALQNPVDGSWGINANAPGNPAITSLAVMAFLSAGHVPGEGRYGETIENGIRWVLRKQQSNGLIATAAAHEMYHHGIATLMLAEVAGMTDGELAREVRRKLEKAVAVILKAQRTRDLSAGGWRYRVADVGDGADISVTGWQLMALRAAKNLGCDVSAQVIDRAVGYIKRSQDDATGGFHYNPYPGSRMTVACTGTSILALEVCGKEYHRSHELLRAGAYLIRKGNLPYWGQDWFFYSIYYGSQAAFQLGGNYWEVYRPRLHEVLLRHQSSTGCWERPARGPQFHDDGQYGRSYCTAMAILALTVDYRYLPIYQRGEESAETTKGDG